MALVCSLCNTRSPSISLWMSHLCQVHRSEVNISVSCPVDECNALYSNVNSLCSHVYRTHNDFLSCSVKNTTTRQVLVDDSTEASSSDFIFDLSLPPSVTHDVNQLLHKDFFEQQKKSVLFLMQLKEERFLTQSAVNDVVLGCTEVFEHTLSRVRAGVSAKLSQAGIDFSDIDGIDSIFSDMSNPFKGLESVYLQDKFISEELECVVSLYSKTHLNLPL